MELINFETGPIKVNTYIIHDGKDAAIIDPGGNIKRILSELESKNLTLTKILLTHGHFDHIGAVEGLKKATGAKVYIHEEDEKMLKSNKYNLSTFTSNGVELTEADVLLKGGEVIDCPSCKLTVIHTPGHTKGCVCYLGDGCIFTGDTLFCESVGRTDFPGGDYNELMQSIKEKLFSLEGDYVVYPGHEEFTTMDNERKNNPCLGFGWDK